MGLCFSKEYQIYVDTDGNDKSTNTPRLPISVEKSTNTDANVYVERMAMSTFFPSSSNSFKSSNSSNSLKVFISSPGRELDNHSPVYTPLDVTTYSKESFLASSTSRSKSIISPRSSMSRNTSYFNSWNGHD